MAIQLAKAAGAEVTGVDNGHKQQLMRELGADHAVDYTTTDLHPGRELSYDLILDVFGERSMFAIRRALAPGGRYAVAGGSVPAMLSSVTVGQLLRSGGRRMGILMVRPNKSDLARLADLAAAGDVRVPIDRTYPLGEVPRALRRLGEGRALGKLVVEIG